MMSLNNFKSYFEKKNKMNYEQIQYQLINFCNFYELVESIYQLELVFFAGLLSQLLKMCG